MTIVRNFKTNFLKDIKMVFELDKDEQLKLPEEKQQRSIFIKLVNIMNEKLCSGEWSKKDYHNFKKELIKIDDKVICCLPDFFVKIISLDKDELRKNAILVRSINLKQRLGELSDSDINYIVKTTESYHIIELIRDITTKSSQFIITDELNKCDSDNLEVLLQQLKSENDNPFKEMLFRKYDTYFEEIRNILGFGEIIDISREELIPNAINKMHCIIRTKKELEEKEKLNYIYHKNHSKKMCVGKPWNDSGNR